MKQKGKSEEFKTIPHPTKPKKTIAITDLESFVANELLANLKNMGEDITYPQRMKWCVIHTCEHRFFLHTAINRWKGVILNVMSRHIRSHSEERHEQYKAELGKVLGPQSNQIVHKLEKGYMFMNPDWNRIWDEATRQVALIDLQKQAIRQAPIFDLQQGHLPYGSSQKMMKIIQDQYDKAVK